MAPKPPKKTAASSGRQFKPTDFVHLHNHSHHSLLDGLQKIPEMLDRVVELGMGAVALTDHGTMSGVIDFYQGCQKRDLKPIIGLEAYVTAPDRSHRDRDRDLDRRRYHIILLAMTDQGYANLMELSTISHLDGFYHKPRLDRDLLEKYNDGLIVLSGCLGGEIGRALSNNQPEDAKATVDWYKSVFGDRYYLEVQDHHNQRQRQLNQAIIDLGDRQSVAVVVTADAHYLKPEDRQAHEVLLCVQTGAYLSDSNRMTLAEYDLHLSDPVAICQRWIDNPEVLENTKAIADRCNVEIEFGKYHLPNFPAPGNMTPDDYLTKLVYRGLVDIYGPDPVADFSNDGADLDGHTTASLKKKLPEAICQRADYELETIKRMGFAEYFLIVWDFCVFGQKNNILFGPGRGSAAGSIISYGLGITTIDPIRYKLLFERFLNPDRISMPDIDIDIEDGRRDEVIDYVVDKYGGDRQVVHISTHGKMAARNSIRDVARVLQVPYREADQIAKMLPLGPGIGDALADSPDLEKIRTKSPENTELFALAQRLEGTIRNHGVHAAGVVIAPDNIELTRFTPLEVSPKGTNASQYPMNPIEALGLLKMDFLGISNLTTVKNTLRIVRKVYGQDLNLARLDLSDPATYDLLAAGDTTGIFQLESAGMRELLRQLKPRSLDDIAVVIALYRPGPLKAGVVEKYIRRRDGQEEVTYPDPIFRDALEETYGLPVYQEQVMQVSRDVCGFSGGEADHLRKAIGKKLKKEMDKLQKKFVEGGIKTGGVDRSVMLQFWDDLVGFADYAFNRSHSVSYGMVAFWTAYLKANYRPAFMAALMTTDSGDIEKLKGKIADASQHLKVLPPDINLSHHEFALIRTDQDGQTTDEIRFGLDAIKTIGSGLVETILTDRNQNGRFAGLSDFCGRLGRERNLTRKVVQNLIKVGAFDFDQNGDRHQLLEQFKQQPGIDGFSNPNQTNLFADQGAALVKADVGLSDSDREQERLGWELELMGVYLSGHPLDRHESTLARLDPTPVSLASLTTTEDFGYSVDEVVTAVGLITNVRPTRTKTDKTPMVFIRIEDKTAALEIPVFPVVYEKQPNEFRIGRIAHLWLRCRQVVHNGQRPDWQLETVTWIQPTDPDQELVDTPNFEASSVDDQRQLWLKVLPGQQAQVGLQQIKQILSDNPGPDQVVLVIGDGQDRRLQPLEQIQTMATTDLIDRLEAIEIVDQVKVTTRPINR